jgi:N-acetylglutamate synthase-like GNAT family acetyltransferase
MKKENKTFESGEEMLEYALNKAKEKHPECVYFTEKYDKEHKFLGFEPFTGYDVKK